MLSLQHNHNNYRRKSRFNRNNSKNKLKNIFLLVGLLFIFGASPILESVESGENFQSTYFGDIPDQDLNNNPNPEDNDNPIAQNTGDPIADLTALWSFEDDLVGYNQHTLSGSVTYTTGKYTGSKAISTSIGVDDSPYFADHADFDIRSGFTWSAWVYPTQFDSLENNDAGAILWKNGEYGLRIHTDGNEANGLGNFQAFSYDTYWHAATSSSIYTTNNWYHVAGTYESGTLKLYVNGALAASTTMSTPSGTSNPFYIGAQGSQTGLEFPGKIDDVRVYHSALTETEIAGIMNQEIYYAQLLEDPNFTEMGTSGMLAEDPHVFTTWGDWGGLAGGDGHSEYDEDYWKYDGGNNRVLLWQGNDDSSTEAGFSYVQQSVSSYYFASSTDESITVYVDTYEIESDGGDNTCNWYIEVDGTKNVVLSVSGKDDENWKRTDNFIKTISASSSTNRAIDSYIRVGFDGLHLDDNGGWFSGDGDEEHFKWDINSIKAYALYTKTQTPYVSHPSDITYTYTGGAASSVTIDWIVSDTSYYIPPTATISGTGISGSVDPNQDWLVESNLVQYYVGDLNPGDYTFTLSLNDGYGGTASDSVNVHVNVALPSAPRNPTTSIYTGTSAGIVHFDWDAPSFNGGDPTNLGYDVWYWDYTNSIWVHLGTTTNTYYNHNGGQNAGGDLVGGQWYNYKVKAYNSAGTENTGAESSIQYYEEPGQVTGLSVTGHGDESVSLSWNSGVYGGGLTPSYRLEWRTTGGSWYTGYKSEITGTSTTVTGLANGQSYDFRVRAYNTMGDGVWSTEDSQAPGAAPTAPQNLRYYGGTAVLDTSYGDEWVRIQWDVPADSNGYAITSYEVWRSESPTSGYSLIDSTGITQNFLDTGLNNDKTYYYKVRAYNAEGWSSYSGYIQTDPRSVPDTTPTPTLSSYGDETVTFSWNAPSGNGRSITNYQVYRATSPTGTYSSIGTTGSGSTRQYTDTGITNGQTYYYKVRAYNSEGWGPLSNYMSAMPRAEPDTPTGLALVSYGDQTVTISWTAPDANGKTIDNYEVFRATSATGTYSSIGTTGSSTAQYTDTGLTNGQTYYYKVRAHNEEGWGVQSNYFAAEPRYSPDTPTGLSFDSYGDHSVTISWNAPDNNGRVIDNYEVFRSTSPTSGYVSVHTTNSGSTTQFTDTGLTNGQNYYYKVRAHNDEGWSSQSSYITANPRTTPDAPTSLSFDTYGDQTVTISWSAPDNNGRTIDNYEVYRSTSPTTGYVSVYTTYSGSTTQFTNTGLTNGQNYYYKVRAHNEEGWGTLSNYITAEPRYSPDAPTGLIISDYGDESITISWSAPDTNGRTIDNYQIYRSTSASSGYSAIGTTGNGISTEYTDTGVTNGVTYYYKVMAHNSEGWGPLSSYISGDARNAPDAPTGLTLNSYGNQTITVSWTAPDDNGRTIDNFAVYRATSPTGTYSSVGTTSSGSTTQFTNDGLTNGITYYYKIMAHNSEGWGTLSGYISAQPKCEPEVPNSLSVISYGNGTLTLSWNAPIENGASIDNYEILRSTSAEGTYSSVGTTGNGITTQFTNNGLINGQVYYYKVRAHNAEGWSELTSYVSGEPRCEPESPTNPQTDSYGDETVSISWTASINNGRSVDNYEIYRSTSPSSGYSSIGTTGSGAVTSYTDNTPTNGIVYYYKISAHNAEGWSTLSTQTSAEARYHPDTPTGLSLVSYGDGYITFSWNAPDSNGRSITNYEIQRSTSAESGYSAIGTTGDGITTQYTDDTATNGVTYYYKVRAQNAEGWSELSVAFNQDARSAPDAPTNPGIADYGDETVTISWNTPDSNGRTITNYQVFRATSPTGSYTSIGTTGSGSTTQYTDSGITNGVDYYYKIRAYNSEGWGELSSYVNGEARDIPDTPTSLTLVTYGDEYITFSWTAPDDNGRTITNYEIQRSTSAASGYTTIGTTGDGITTQYTDNTATNGVTYYYKVRAQNEEGWSDLSVYFTQDSRSHPDAPSSPSLDSYGDQTVTISWTAPDDNGRTITNYEILRATSPTGTYSSAGYTGSGSTTEFTDTGITNGVDYYYKIRAYNSEGWGDLSSYVAAEPRSVPDTPNGLTLDSYGDQTVTFSWSTPDSNGRTIDNYEIYRATSPTGTYSSIGTTGNGIDTEFIDTGLTNGQTYYYKVRAHNAEGWSALSNYLGAEPRYTADIITTLTASDYGNGTITLSWSEPDNNGRSISNYEIYRSTISNGVYTSVGTTGSGAITEYTDTGLTNGQMYYYKVRAYNAEGWNGLSSYVAEEPRTVTDPVSWDVMTNATMENSGSVTLRWSQPYNGGKAITKYSIYLREKGEGSWNTPINILGNPPSTEYTVTGLTNGQEYEFMITATNIEGESANSEIIYAIPHVTLSAPIITTLSNGDGSYTIQWSQPSNTDSCRPIDHYVIYRGTSSGSLLELGTTSSLSSSTTGLTNGQQYYFEITAVDDLGEEGSSTAEFWIMPMTNPNTPSKPSVTPSDNHTMVSWSAVSGNGVDIDHYEIWRKEDSGSFVLLANTTSTSYDDLTTNNGHDYWYQIRATTYEAIHYDGADTTEKRYYSGYSTTSDLAEPKTVPNTPALSGTFGNHQVELNWNIPFDGGDSLIGYEIYRTTTQGVYNYNEPIQSISNPSTITWTDTGLTNGESYWYTIKANNSLGYSVASAETSEQIPASTPLAITDISVTNSSGYVRLDWDWSDTLANGRTPTKFYIYRSNANETSPLSLYDTIETTFLETYTDSNIVIYSNYHYIIQVENSLGKGVNSSSVKAFPEPGPPVAPYDVTTQSVGDGSISISWDFNGTDGSTDLDRGYFYNYTVYRGLISTFTCDASSRINTTTSSSQQTYTDNSVSNGQTYYYKVMAANGNGYGAASESTTGTPYTTPDQVQNVQITYGVSQELTISWDLLSTDFQETYFDGGREIDNYYVYRSNDGSSYTLVYTANGDEDSWTDTGLTNGHTYYYKVSAENIAGEGTDSAISSEYPSRVPYSPILNTVTAVTGGVQITWTSPSNNGGDSVDSFEIYRGTSIDNMQLVQTIDNPSTTTWKDTDVSYGLTYYYKLAAINRVGVGDNSSSLSAMPITTPSAPQNVQITTVASGVISLFWNAPSYTGGDGVDITGYVIYTYNTLTTTWEEAGTTSSAVTTFTDHSLNNGYYYSYKIAAYNNNSRTATPGGEGTNSTTVVGRPITVPDAPDSIEVILVDDSTVQIQWAEPSYTGGNEVDIDGYVIYRKEGTEGTWAELGTRTSAQLSFTDSGLTNGEYYYYKVSAWNNGSRTPGNPTLNPGGEGANSSIVCGKPITTPDAPDSIEVILVDDSSVQIQWTAPSFTGGTNVDIDGYVVYRQINGEGSWDVVALNSSSELTYLDHEVTNGYYYNYKVAAWNNGSRTPSNPSLNPGGEGDNSTIVNARPITTPDAPENFQVILVDDSTVQIQWNEPTYTGGTNVDIDGYVVYRQINGEGSWDVVALNENNEFSFTDIGLTNGYNYYYKVAAWNNGSRTPSNPTFNPGGEGVKTSAICARPITVPNAPNTLDIILVDDSTVQIQWTAPSFTGGTNVDIDGYVVYRQINGEGSWDVVALNSSSEFTYLDYEVTNGYYYNYKVAAWNNGSRTPSNPSLNPGGEGDNSTIVNARPITTPDAPENFQVILVNDSTVQIQWTTPSYTGGENVDIDGYVVYRQINGEGSWDVVALNENNEFSFTDTGLTNGYYYYYKVAAWNNASRTPSNPTFNPGGEGVKTFAICGRPLTLPDAPENLDVVLIDDELIKIQWNQPSFTGGSNVLIDGYVVYRKETPAGDWEVVALNSSSELSFIDTEVTNGFYYDYKVAAWNNGSRTPSNPSLNPGGEGDNSTIVNARPITVPDAPNSLDVILVADEVVQIQWAAPTFTGGESVSIDGYVVYRQENSGNWQVISFNTSTEFTFYDYDLTNGNYYYYKVSAWNNGSRTPNNPNLNPGGEGANSTIVCGRPITLPDAPENLEVITISSGSIQIQWDEPIFTGGNNVIIDGYVVYYQEYNGTGHLTQDWTISNENIEGTTYTYTHSGLENGYYYNYKVSAFNNGSRDPANEALNPGGEGAQSYSVNARPIDTPGSPNSINVILVTDGTVQIQWTAPIFTGGQNVDLDGYVVYRKDNVGEVWQVVSLNSSSEFSFIDTGLTNGLYYDYRVAAWNNGSRTPFNSALNPGGEGDLSSSVNARPITTPGAPEDIAVTNIDDQSVTIEWKEPGFTGGIDVLISGYLVYYQEYSRLGSLEQDWTVLTESLSASTFSYIANGLTNGNSYNFKVAAWNNGSRTPSNPTFNPGGEGDNSTVVNSVPITVPDAPENISKLLVGNSTVQIIWNAPEIDGGNSIDGYVVYRMQNGDNNWVEVALNASDEFTFLDTGLTNGYYYYYKVAAWNNGSRMPETPSLNPGGEGANSSIVCGRPITTPDAPDSIQVILVDDSSVQIQWTTPSFTGGTNVDINGYVVYRQLNGAGEWVEVALNSSDEFTFLDTGLTNGDYYYYKVAAWNNGSRTPTQANLNPGGEGANSTIVCGRPITTPDAPDSIEVILVDNSTVQIRWTAPSFTGGTNVDINGYVVYRQLNGAGEWVEVALNASDEFTFLDTGLTNGYYYYYKVAAWNNGSRTPTQANLNPGGEGANSSIVCGRPITTPDAPDSIAVILIDSQLVEIQWTSPSFSGGVNVDISGYVVYRKHNDGDWEEIALNASDEFTFLDTGLTNGDYYYYKVAAWNNGSRIPETPSLNPGGEGTNSSIVCGRPITTPDAPATFYVVQEYDQKLHLAWTNPANDGGDSIDGYILYRGTSSNNLQVYKIWFDPTLREYNDTGLNNGFMYYYALTAFNNGTYDSDQNPPNPLLNPGGESIKTGTIGAMPITVPTAPLNFVATAQDGGVMLTWNTPSYTGGVLLSGYVIYRGTDAGSLSYLTTIGVSNSYLDNDASLELGTTYYYRIAAYNNNSRDALPGGEGTLSADIPHATPTLTLTFTVLNASGSAISNADVSLIDLNGIYSQTITSGPGGVTQFTGLNRSSAYQILIQKDSYTVYNISDFAIDTTVFTMSETIICNLTNIEINLLDFTDKIVENATVEFSESVSGTIFTGVTDEEGSISFNEIYNATWDLSIKFTTGNNDYEFIVNDTDSYILKTNLAYKEINLRANLTTILINATDPEVKFPYNALYNANITLVDSNNGNNLTSFYTNSSGFAEFQVPAGTFNLTISYLNKLREYECINEPITFATEFSHALDFYSYTDWHFEVKINEIATSLFNKESVYDEPSWGSHDNNYDNMDQIPNYAEIYYRDGITFTLFWQNNRDLSGIENITTSGWNTWSLMFNEAEIDNETKHPYAIQPVNGEAGNYSFVFDSETYGNSGIYTLSIVFGDNDDYQFAEYVISIEVMNFTSQIVYTSASDDASERTCIFGQEMIIEFELSSILPITESIDNANLYWNVIGESVSGQLNHIGGVDSGVYQISHIFNDLSPSSYYIQVYGFEANYDYINWDSIRITVNPRQTNMDSTIDPLFEITGTYMVTAWDDNVTVDFELIDQLTGLPLSGISIYIEYNGTVYDENCAYVFNIDSDSYQFSIPAEWSEEGVHSLYIQLSKDNYVSSEITIDVQVFETWSTIIELDDPPEAANWNEQIDFSIHYECNQAPRDGTLLTGSNITQIEILAGVSGNIYHQITLTESTYNNIWGYTDLGAGDYQVWINTNALNLTEKTLFYVTPTFNNSNYEQGVITTYLYVSPLETSWVITTPNNDGNGEDFSYLEIESSVDGMLTIQGTYLVNQPGNSYDGNEITGGTAYYSITNIDDESVVVPTTEMMEIGGGRYIYQVFADGANLGEYRITMWIQAENYAFQNTTFIYKLIKDIEFEVELDIDQQIGPTSVKIAHGESLNIFINVTDINAINPEIKIYINEIEMSSSYITEISAKEFMYSQEITSNDFPAGSYTIRIVVSEDLFNTADTEIDLNVLEYWSTDGFLEFESVELKTWGSNISFNIRYYADENPRYDNILNQAQISSIEFATSLSGLTISQKILDQSTYGQYWSMNWVEYDPDYNIDIYSVTVNSSVLNLTTKETFKIFVTIEQEYYEAKVFDSYFWLDTVDTQLSSPDGEILEMGMDRQNTFQFQLIVDDYNSGLNGNYLADAKISYVIENASITLMGETTTYLGNGLYELTIDPISNNLYNGTYTFSLVSTHENFTNSQLEITLDIKPGSVEFDIYLDDNYAIDSYSLQASIRENITIEMELDSLLDVSNLNIQVLIDSVEIFDVVYQDEFENHNYTITFNASEISIGLHELQIIASKFGYASDIAELNLEIVEAWATDVEIVTPPTIKPWNSNVSLIFRYECVDEPRDTYKISDAIISGIQLDMVTDTGAETKLVLDQTSNAWGWESLDSQLGAGLYLVWFNTSYLTVEEVSSFYITPTIIDPNGIYEMNTLSPFLWIEPVETAISLTSDKIEELVLNGITLQLNESTDIYARYYVSDIESIINGMSINGASIEYRIYNKTDNSYISTIDFELISSNNGYYYSAELTGLIEGSYTVRVYATLMNYSQAITSFTFNVIKRTLSPEIDFNTEEEPISSPQNEDLVIDIEVTDELTGEPLTGGILSVTLNGIQYNFTEIADEPGKYRIKIDAEDITALPEDELYEITCVLTKANYTTSSFTIYLNVGLRVDPVFGVPYRYWVIGAITIGVMVGFVAVRQAYIKSNTPEMIININKVAKQIKKKKKISGRQFGKTEEEMLYKMFNADWRSLKLDMKAAINIHNNSDLPKSRKEHKSKLDKNNLMKVEKAIDTIADETKTESKDEE